MKIQVSSFKFQVSSVAHRRVAAMPQRRIGFSLVEVLLAIFILGIGLIMVASVFPVGATWTRQATEESIAQTIAQNAYSVLQKHYGPGGNLRSYFAPDFFTVTNPGPPAVLAPDNSNRNTVLQADFNHTNGVPVGTAFPAFHVDPFVLQALPGFYGIPLSERAYLFGSTTPFPVPANKLASCTYFWTALIRLSPAHQVPLGTFSANGNGIKPSSSYTYDLYILVFRKGTDQRFNFGPSVVPPGSPEISTVRMDTMTPLPITPEMMPSLVYAQYAPGSNNGGSTPVTNAFPPMGQLGIGARSGTVFRQVLDPATYANAVARPALLGQPVSALPQEPIIFAPAADGTPNSASPLIYVYQTTVSF